MSELRWNPLLGTWTIVAANRQNRPNMPKEYCPFCPGEGKNLPEDFDVLMFPNDFPALSEGIEGTWDIEDNDLYKNAIAKGNCEVILYSSNHTKQLHELSDEHVGNLVQLWISRFEFYQKQSIVKYIYEFENRGEAVGVTMPHPHGQLYAFPFVPLKIETELVNCKNYYEKHQRNMLEDMIIEEKRDGSRVIFETDTFLVFLPHFTDYPYGIFIVSKLDKVCINEFDLEQQKELGIVLKLVNGMFDTLYDQLFPYMMVMHQGTVNDEKWKDQQNYYRFHIEYYPPWRAPNTIKYYASAEMGAWAATNTRNVEDTAVELIIALEKFKSKQS